MLSYNFKNGKRAHRFHSLECNGMEWVRFRCPFDWLTVIGASNGCPLTSRCSRHVCAVFCLARSMNIVQISNHYARAR